MNTAATASAIVRRGCFGIISIRCNSCSSSQQSYRVDKCFIIHASFLLQWSIILSQSFFILSSVPAKANNCPIIIREISLVRDTISSSCFVDNTLESIQHAVDTTFESMPPSGASKTSGKFGVNYSPGVLTIVIMQPHGSNSRCS